jgi:IclR family mhp operon transcriptional activator
MLKQTYARGLATRDPRVRTVSNTLAVPVYEQSRVVASVGLTFFSSAMETDEAIRQFRGELSGLSANISKQLGALTDNVSGDVWEQLPQSASA